MHVADFSYFPTPNPEGSAMIHCRCWDPKAYKEAISDHDIPDNEFWAEAGCIAVGTIVPLHIQARSILELSYFYPLPY
jgi:hypothetical protein